ncbi:MAG: hypothetical protein AB7D39_05800 [Pseudodesulfovibrio sp.]|uniref:hypothetical protein n=1 Tax=Pseudodesulfovibrio sp. TaxID=2035812 RepID=UPI003D0F2012
MSMVKRFPMGVFSLNMFLDGTCFLGGIGTSKNVKKHLREQKKEYTDENDWKIKKELDNEANDYNVFKGIWDTVTTDTDHEIYDKRVNNAKNRVGK